MFRTAITIVLAGLLTACAITPSLPPPPALQIADGSRVGVIVTGLDRSAIHEHVGLTIFNNFSVERTLPWHLGQRVRASLSSELSKRSLVPVQLEAEELGNVDPEKMVVEAGARGWEIPAGSTDVVQSLKQHHRIDALIVVTGKPTLAVLQCTGGPCTPRMLPKTGLFTRGVFNVSNHFVVPAYETRVFSLNPAADLSSYDPVYSITKNQSRMMVGDARPKDLKNISDAEFAVVANMIDEYTQRVAAAAAEVIKGEAKLPR